MTTVPRKAASQGRATRLIFGIGLLLSVPVWWWALALWANGESGYLGLPGTGVTAFLWLTLMTIGGVVLMLASLTPPNTRLRSGVVLALFLALAALIALPNAVAGLSGNVGAGGIAMAVFSAAQVAAFAFAILHRR